MKIIGFIFVVYGAVSAIDAGFGESDDSWPFWLSALPTTQAWLLRGGMIAAGLIILSTNFGNKPLMSRRERRRRAKARRDF